MTLTSFSPKQKTVLTWWTGKSPYHKMEAIICDGAVRSGKTLSMSLSFFLWAMCCFNGRRFGLCGRTIISLRRNVLKEIVPVLGELGLKCTEKRSENLLTVTWKGRTNEFYQFGGKDEGAASLIQGVTFGGVLMDEVALMPRSFVEQAMARCSLAGSRIWFNCNPEGPGHWFYKEWILGANEKKALYLHFTMEDNPSLTRQIRERYERLYTGTFYERFILGKWVSVEGRVYDFFTQDMAVERPEEPCGEYYISCDYGTVNPTSFGLWGSKAGVWYRLNEYYYDSKREGRQLTDGEYARALARLAGGRKIRAVVIDPSAASFSELLRREGWHVKKADNDVLSGIRRTAELLKNGKIKICSGCCDCLREMELYAWDDKNGKDTVRKEYDHAMDDMRYFAATILGGTETAFGAQAVARRTGGIR